MMPTLVNCLLVMTLAAALFTYIKKDSSCCTYIRDLFFILLRLFGLSMSWYSGCCPWGGLNIQFKVKGYKINWMIDVRVWGTKPATSFSELCSTAASDWNTSSSTLTNEKALLPPLLSEWVHSQTWRPTLRVRVSAREDPSSKKHLKYMSSSWLWYLSSGHSGFNSLILI